MKNIIERIENLPDGYSVYGLDYDNIPEDFIALSAELKQFVRDAVAVIGAANECEDCFRCRHNAAAFLEKYKGENR